MKLKKCLNCSKLFDRPLRSKKGSFKISWPNYRKRIFCSTKCKGLWQKKYRTGKNNFNWRGGKTKCKNCKIELAARYTNSPSHPKTLRCRKCWFKFLKESPENHPNWKGGLPARFSNCKFCNEMTKDPASIMCWNCYKIHRKEFVCRGEKHYKWKGGILCHQNYIWILMPKHPTSQAGYIAEHRYSAECQLGRFLESEEIIHHIDEDKQNNLPKNLYLFPSRSKHYIFHNLKKKPKIESNLI